MGFEITQSAVFYIIVMLVVVFIGLAIVAKGNPIILLKQTQFAGIFEPGKVLPKEDINPYVGLACSESPQKVIIDKASFIYKGKPGDKEGSIDFVILLDYKTRLFIGTDTEGTVQKLSCTSAAADQFSDCPAPAGGFTFDLRGAPAFDSSGKELLHFTIWRSNRALIDAVDGKTTLDKMLETYSYYYVSSFDATKDVAGSCLQSSCKTSNSKDDCQANNGCYWTSNWYFWHSCQACPTYYADECSKYDKTQCTVCPSAVQNCEPTLFGCGQRETSGGGGF